MTNAPVENCLKCAAVVGVLESFNGSTPHKQNECAQDKANKSGFNIASLIRRRERTRRPCEVRAGTWSRRVGECAAVLRTPMGQ